MSTLPTSANLVLRHHLHNPDPPACIINLALHTPLHRRGNSKSVPLADVDIMTGQTKDSPDRRMASALNSPITFISLPATIARVSTNIVPSSIIPTWNSSSIWCPATSLTRRHHRAFIPPFNTGEFHSTASTTKIIATASAPPSAQLSSAPTTSPSPPPVTTVLTILSTIVGICVLIGSLLYKLPQIIRVVRRRSADGISVLMYSLETIGTTFSALYFARRAFPFSTYGEAIFIMIQNVILLALIVKYQRLPRVPATILALLYFGMVISLLSPFVPLSLLVALQLCSIPILNLARVPQLILNYRRNATGELSPITLGLQLLGNVARIFTTIAQVKDPLMFAAICVSTCFNTALFVQWIYYARKIRISIASQLTNS